MSKAPKGVLLLAFGGPDSLDAIEPFMTNLMGGRKPPPVVVEKVKERYKLIGGQSPLPETTRLQAAALEAELNKRGARFKVYVGMRYWRPSIEEAIADMSRDGVQEAVALSLSPHYAEVTTGAYKKGIAEALEKSGVDISVKMAGSWYEHPLYIEALSEKINEAIQQFSPAERADVPVIFSAHSLPLSHIEGGDPYVDQINTTIKLLVERLKIKQWYLGYQSMGGGQEPWLGPATEAVLDKIKETGHDRVLVVPVSFATDHIETMYDIDILQKNHAEKIGLKFARAAALNVAPKFIQALAEVVEQTL